jgi:hypothetical protein
LKRTRRHSNHVAPEGANRIAAGSGHDRRTERAALWRYLLSWLLSSAVVVMLLALALDAPSDPPPQLLRAAERASCRLTVDGDDNAARAGEVLLRYRRTLSAAQSARLSDVIGRLAGLATPEADADLPDAVAVETGEARLGCSRVDRRAEEVLILFIGHYAAGE